MPMSPGYVPFHPNPSKPAYKPPAGAVVEPREEERVERAAQRGLQAGGRVSPVGRAPLRRQADDAVTARSK